MVHVGVLSALAAATFTPEVRKAVANINSALIPSMKGGTEEMVHMYTDPSNSPRDQATGEEGAASGQAGGGMNSSIGTGPPSGTPTVTGGSGRGISEKGSLPGVKIAANVSGLSLLPAAPGQDLGGGGGIAGDPAYGTSDIGVALDQIAREILRHLSQHKLTVVWLFDESESMKDDQKTIKKKFDRVASELKAHTDADRKASGALNHAIVGFGQNIHYELEKPTFDIDHIGRAIDRLKIDDTGVENTLHAVHDVINHYSGLIRKDRKLLIVLITDESGDDGDYIEEARQAAMSRGVPIYIIGRQSLFGYGELHLLYIDPVTKDHYWPAIRRGPETADVEALQWDGIRHRQDEQPSGFAPYELARLAKDTGGIYFLLPSIEAQRVRQREQAYSMSTLKEYIPDYESRTAYAERRAKSELRSTLYEIIKTTRDSNTKTEFSIIPDQLVAEGAHAIEEATVRLSILINMEKKLRSLAKNRDRETDKRWQAAYDLMLAQIVAYQVLTFEYRAGVEELVKKRPRPSKLPIPGKLDVWWGFGHSHDRKAPKDQTEKKYIEAERLIKLVIERHPKTPWADLAQDTLNRGLSMGWGEGSHTPSPQYNERAKLVPKF